MPEHEIAKHTKEIYKTWRDPDKSWKHKLGEIAIEILIIVFAITLSLLVERWREHAHEQKMEQQFLIGLKKDLQSDLNQQQGDSLNFAMVKAGWKYFYISGTNKNILNKDSVHKYAFSLLNTTAFLPNDSRFEALKSSGNINVIEDDSLQNLILDLYQNKLKTVAMSDETANQLKLTQLFPYVMDNLDIQNDSTSNLDALIQSKKMRNFFRSYQSADEIISRYHDAMQQSRSIISMINKQYDLK